MSERPMRETRSVLLAVVTIVLVLGLAVQVIRQKGENGALRAAMAGGSQVMIAGNPLPPVPLAVGGRTDSLNERCRLGDQLLTVFSRDGCRPCEQVRERIRDITARRGDIRVIHVRVGPPSDRPGALAERDSAAADADVSFRDYFRFFRVNRVPVLLLSNRSCRVAGVGVGGEAAEVMLDRLGGMP